MYKYSQCQSPERNKSANNSQKLELSSNNSLRCSYENKQSFPFSDGQTKASSIISSGTHQNSFDFSQTSFQKQPNKADDFLHEELLLQRKVIQKQLILSEDCFTKQFIQHLKPQLCMFVKNPSNCSFHNFLQLIIKPKINIFPNELSKPIQNPKSCSFKQVMQMLVAQGKNQYFIHTFNLVISPLTFYIVLIIYWIQPKLDMPENLIQISTQISKQKNHFVSQAKIRQNIITITKTYIQSHSQQINQNQSLFLLIMYFLDELKKFNQSQSSTLTFLQRDLIKDIKTFRSIQNVDKILTTLHVKIFQSKLSKFQKNNPFITSPDSVFHMIKSYIFENFGSISLQKIYQVNDQIDYRNLYQLKKDAFCFWVLKNIINSEEKNISMLQNTSQHIIKLMEMLKKFKNQNNIQGISYLVPILANLKTFLPKAWKHVVKKRPDIQKKFSQYTDLMLQHKFKLTYLQQNGVIWGQTNFIMAQKIIKHIGKKKLIDLDEHKKYFYDFLSHFLYYRQKSKQHLIQPKFQLVLENQAQVGFSIGLIQSYLANKYSKNSLSQQWSCLIQKANKINENISQSLISDIIDYCFVGSTQKYQKADI